MTTRIVTKSKSDIETGFDITFKDDAYKSTKEAFLEAFGSLGYRTDLFPEEIFEEMAKDSTDQEKKALEGFLDEAEEIFIEEASVSRWSGNMMDNSIIGIGGKMPTVVGYVVSMDVRIGVNSNAIKTGNGNWTARPAKRLRLKSTGVVYEYNGYRMHPGVDYSKYLDDGTAKIPNAAAWAGFVKRAEDRFYA